MKGLIVASREALHLTQEDVADRANVPLRSYQRWEAGEVMPRRPARRALERALELDDGALEPPTEPQDPANGHDVHAALEDVIARLTRIEAFLTPDEKAAASVEDEARRVREQRQAGGTGRRGPRRGTAGR